MNCHRVQNLLSAYLDQELTSEERRLVRNHIFHCPACSESYEELNTLKNYLGNLEPPTFEPESLLKLSMMTFPESLSTDARYHTLFWGKRLLLTCSCIFLFLLTSFSLFPVTAPTGGARQQVDRQQTEATPFVHKPTRYQIMQDQNHNLLVGSTVKKEDKEKEEIESAPWWEDSMHLPVVPVSHR